MAFIGFCVLGVGALFSLFLFAEPSTRTFQCLLFGILGCFVVVMILTGIFTGIETDESTGTEFPGENDVDRYPPDHIKDIIAENKARDTRTFRMYFVGAVVATFIIKTVGMAVAIVFAAADLVQFLGMIDYEIPDTEINSFLDLLGSDIGSKKAIPIVLSIVCNIIFHDKLIKDHLDKNKSSWEIVDLEFLYFIVETIDNYAGLCLGNVS